MSHSPPEQTIIKNLYIDIYIIKSRSESSKKEHSQDFLIFGLSDSAQKNIL